MAPVTPPTDLPSPESLGLPKGTKIVLPSGRVSPPTWRRQFNQSFLTPDGNFSWPKSIAIAAQLVALWHLHHNFALLIDRWDSLLVILGFIIMPDIVKKIINMKYGGGETPGKK